MSHPGYFTAEGKKRSSSPAFSEDEADPKEIPFQTIPWWTTPWKMQEGWKPTIMIPSYVHPHDPRGHRHIPLEQRQADRLMNTKDLRIHHPRVIPSEKIGDRETTELRVRDQARVPNSQLNMERLNRHDQLERRGKMGTNQKRQETCFPDWSRL